MVLKIMKPAALKRFKKTAVMKRFTKTQPMKAMKATKASKPAAPPSSQALVVVEKKVKSETIFNQAYLNLLESRKFKDLSEQEQSDLVEALPIPSRSMYSAFHAATCQGSTSPTGHAKRGHDVVRYIYIYRLQEYVEQHKETI
ncbi:hypothetical protein N9L68_08415 [bacterium]|nr:hypothetical protein [bacterium]